MNKFIKISMIALSLLYAVNANARPRYSNSYYTSGRTTYGYNAGTGSRWSSSSYGNISTGIDKRGNSWSYNRSTGVYTNSNGQVRIGRGSNRIRF